MARCANYITQITVGNATAATSTYVEIQDGSGGTTFYTIPAAFGYGGATLNFPATQAAHGGHGAVRTNARARPEPVA